MFAASLRSQSIVEKVENLKELRGHAAIYYMLCTSPGTWQDATPDASSPYVGEIVNSSACPRFLVRHDRYSSAEGQRLGCCFKPSQQAWLARSRYATCDGATQPVGALLGALGGRRLALVGDSVTHQLWNALVTAIFQSGRAVRVTLRHKDVEMRRRNYLPDDVCSATGHGPPGGSELNFSLAPVMPRTRTGGVGGAAATAAAAASGDDVGVRCRVVGAAGGKSGSGAEGSAWLARPLCEQLPDEEILVPSTGTRLLWWRINGNFSMGVRGATAAVRARCLTAEHSFAARVDAALASADVAVVQFGPWYNGWRNDSRYSPENQAKARGGPPSRPARAASRSASRGVGSKGGSKGGGGGGSRRRPQRAAVAAVAGRRLEHGLLTALQNGSLLLDRPPPPPPPPPSASPPPHSLRPSNGRAGRGRGGRGNKGRGAQHARDGVMPMGARGGAGAVAAAAARLAASGGGGPRIDGPEAYAVAMRHVASRLARLRPPHRLGLLAEPAPQHFNTPAGTGLWGDVTHASPTCPRSCAPLASGWGAAPDRRSQLVHAAAAEAGLPASRVLPLAHVLRPLHALHLHAKQGCRVDCTHFCYHPRVWEGILDALTRRVANWAH